MISRRMLLLLDAMCVGGVGWCAVLIAGLLRDDRRVSATVAVTVAAVLVLPGFIAGVVTNRRVVRGRQPQSGWVRSVYAPPADLPKWALVLSGLVFLAFWVAGISAFTGLSQDVPAGDSAAQERQVSHQQRFALGVLGGVGTGGSTLAAGALLRGRRSTRAGTREMAGR